jgi:hypothetical protein
MAVGRPKKFPGEDLHKLTVRVPTSLRDYLMLVDRSTPQVALEILGFARELSEELDECRVALVLSAAQHGDDYALTKAHTLARLVKAGLEAEKLWPLPPPKQKKR